MPPAPLPSRVRLVCHMFPNRIEPVTGTFVLEKAVAVARHVPVSVVAPEDLVLSKLVWAQRSGSDLQFRDVRQMIKNVHDMDGGYLKTWAKRLQIDDLLTKAYE